VAQRLRERLTYANVVGSLALFIALGGVSYAAVTLPANSVGTAQLKNRSVTPAKLALKTKKALRGKRGPAGPKGDTGPTVAGAPAGPPKVTVRRNDGSIPVSCSPSIITPGFFTCTGTGSVRAECNAGERVVGGSAQADPGTLAVITSSAPQPADNPTAWVADATVNNSFAAAGMSSAPLSVTAICAG
jgi:hypothetical protein